MKLVKNLFLLLVGLFVTNVAISQNPNQSVDTLPIMVNDSISVIQVDTIYGDTTEFTLRKSDDAVETPVKYNAVDSMRSLVKDKKVILYGKAIVKYEDIELTAEYIELDMATNVVYARGVIDSTGKEIGKPHFKDNSDEFTSTTMRYNFKTKKGITTGVFKEEGGGYIHGEISKTNSENVICLAGGKYTTCNLDHPHFYFKLTKAKMIPDDKIISGPAFLVVGDVPIYAPMLPFGFFPNQKGHASGLLIPEYGEENNRGFYLRNGGWYFAINDYVDFQLRGEIYSKKWSWGLHGISNYKKRYKYSGNFNAKYSVVNEIVDNQKKLISVRWKHVQDPKANPGSDFRASVDFSSTQSDKYTAQSTNRQLTNQKHSSISYSKRWANTPFSLSSALKHSQNSRDSTINLTLPDVAFSMSRIYPMKRKSPVGGVKWYEKVGVSYKANFMNSVHVREDSLFFPQTVDEFKNGIKHSIPVSTSMKLLNFITVNPSVNYTGKMYFSQLNKVADSVKVDSVLPDFYLKEKGFNMVHDFRVSTAFSSKIYGMYSSKKSGSKIKAMRHVMTPSVSLNYRPDITQSYYDSLVRLDYNNETQFYDPSTEYYSHYDNYMYGGAPSKGEVKMVNFGLGNNLEMKVRNDKDTTSDYNKIKILESLSFNTSYNAAIDSLNWSPLMIRGRTNLFKIFDINFDGTFNPYSVNEDGNIINEYVWNTQDEFSIGRLTRANAAVGMRFSPKKSKKVIEEKSKKISSDYLDYYVDFDIPWTLNVNYKLTYTSVPTRDISKDIKQTIDVSGDIKITEKWKIGFKSGYDIKTKEFSFARFDVYRDMHCWEMKFDWTPFGQFKQYGFQINVKSSILQDLKLNKRKSYYDYF